MTSGKIENIHYGSTLGISGPMYPFKESELT